VAGHSKWANIQHRKGRQDEKRGKVWTRVIREIMVAARTGRGRPERQPPAAAGGGQGQGRQPARIDTVKRNIDKATGNLEGVNYEEIRYEGYGIGGAAIIVDTMTDNKRAHRGRCAPRLQQVRWQHGHGEGSVAFQFKHCGQLVFAPGTSEDKVMEVALDAGAEDVVSGDEGAIEVLTPYGRLRSVCANALEAAGLKAELAEVTMRPENTVALDGRGGRQNAKAAGHH
jgi:YebC/PmpR family DNA-binding regulatory protein